MPELAEVQIIADQLNFLTPYHIDDVQLVVPRWLKHGQLTTGDIVKVERWGKRIKFVFEDDRCWVVSLGMTGSVRFQTDMSKHSVLIMKSEHREPIVFYDPRKFGNIYCFDNQIEAEKYLKDKIGIDAAQQLSAQELYDMFSRRKVMIKSALLQQTPLSGIGNYLADEILWEARIHPQTICNNISLHGWQKINKAKDKVINTALEKKGLSIKDYVQTDGSQGDMLNSLQVYGKKGEACPRCGNNISKIYVSQRGTHYCPACQNI